MPKKRETLRSEFADIKAHSRTPEIVATLLLGWEEFLNFAREIKTISQEEYDKYFQDGKEAFINAGKSQKEYQRIEDDCKKFLHYLRVALSSGSAHLLDFQTKDVPEDECAWGWKTCTDSGSINKFIPQGQSIGWVDDVELILSPHSSYSMANKIAKEVNDQITTTPKTLFKRLAQKGYSVVQGDKERNLIRKTINGRREYFLILKDKRCLLEEQ